MQQKPQVKSDKKVYSLHRLPVPVKINDHIVTPLLLCSRVAYPATLRLFLKPVICISE
jgi:hypothetical protein